MIIIVGLGNYGKEYARTYHNMGFMALDLFAEKLGKKIKNSECNALTQILSINGEEVLLVKPMTYMNNSGQAVKGILNKYKATADDLIVLYDDIDIDRFTVRARLEGSAGTHNGMKSIIADINTKTFKRIRLGTGRGLGDLANFVLSEINKKDMEDFEVMFQKVGEGLLKYIKDGNFEALMRELN